MRRILMILAVLVGMLVVGCSVFSPLPAYAQAHTHDENSEDVFSIDADGTVHVDGLVFKNMTEYVNSDYFVERGRRCGTTAKRQFYKGSPLGSASDCSLSKTVIRSEYWPSGSYTIPVVFHVIYRSDGTGNISDQRINDMVGVLNEDYRAISGSLGAQGYDTKIQFQLAGITRTVNNTWFQDQQEYQYKSTLGWDQSKYLNVYTNSASGYLGYSYLPQDLPSKVYDGVVILYETVGGRGTGPDPYDQGRSLVHEIGHYLGLLHTFEDYGCYTGFTAGDLIADTNSEDDEHYDCSQTYTCGTADPIHNYMNYTDDLCMYEFTDEQANRMVCTILNYRPSLFVNTQPTITVTSPNGGENWTVGSKYTITWTYTGTVGNVKIEYTTNNGSSWSTIVSSTTNDGSYSWTVPNAPSSQCKVRIKEASDGSPSDTSNAVFTISTSGGGSPALSLNRTQLYFTILSSGVRTGAQKILIRNSGTGTLNWSVSDSASWLACSPVSGTNAGIVSVTVDSVWLAPGTYTGTITVSAGSAANSPRSVTVTLTVKDYTQDQPPLGQFTTPNDGASVSSSIPVTGWALDDVQIQDLKLYINGNYLGDAVFIEGARPDVELAYPGYPNNYQAGWGYMMLTNFLPDGTYSLSAMAADNTGNLVNLGVKYITINNAFAVKPFGAIDTPAQGATAAGTKYRNLGWVLTPRPNSIPVNGSTIQVYLDGNHLGHATYNIYRADIASLFPGYANSNGALAYFDINTTGYASGVHSIYWAVSDSAGNTDGIGSRYFTIVNTGGKRDDQNQASLAGLFSFDPGNLPEDIIYTADKPITVKKGHGKNTSVEGVYPDQSGNTCVEIRELQPLELELGGSGWQGCLETGSRFGLLPIGSTLDRDRGIFYWIPGPGFVGDYALLFYNDITHTVRRIHIGILPKSSE